MSQFFELFTRLAVILPAAAWERALSDAVIRPSVRPSVCLSIAPLQLRCRPPELCGLRIRPRTDVDPPRSAVAYRLAAR